MLNSKYLIAVLALGIGIVTAWDAQARPGIVARFEPSLSAENTDLKLRVLIIDPIGVIKKVILKVRLRQDQPEKTLEAKPLKETKPDNSESTIWQAVVPAHEVPPAPAWLEVKAYLLTEHSGMVLTLGEFEPLEVQIVGVRQAEQVRKLLRRSTAQLQGDFPFVGGIGVELRAATSARIRALLVGSGKIARRWELGVKVSVGPTFHPPQGFKAEGPLALGFEICSRRRFPTISSLGFDIFTEIFSGTDLRFPGIDPNFGLRIGGSFPLGGEARVDLALGGAFAGFDVGSSSPDLGFTGGLQSIIRFGNFSESTSNTHAKK